LEEKCRMQKSLKLFGHRDNLSSYMDSLASRHKTNPDLQLKPAGKDDHLIIKIWNRGHEFSQFLVGLFPSIQVLVLYNQNHHFWPYHLPYTSLDIPSLFRFWSGTLTTLFMHTFPYCEDAEFPQFMNALHSVSTLRALYIHLFDLDGAQNESICSLASDILSRLERFHVTYFDDSCLLALDPTKLKDLYIIATNSK